ncbi:NAD(P)/FAD-dependent oxidoreductase [Thermoflavifilum thermophilum]|uniref:D-amino-acid dehydrogenase n=1 Tax=Thermoflavifilum thermophilum TaxID=1393122 RepID=A0A1I7N3P8_9BACT|nr:FAD-dependent oxidoreductase [Thermoflavifilum thermophilum]SFV29274.1 D-amino-acid dehydrogenase [Thermoflavifilum thermophilum]
MAETVGIIGGGIVGLCTAYYLHQKGYEVHILDEYAFDNSCSWGNAGMIVPSHVIPLAAPGVVWQGLKWMFRAESPFAFHVSFNKSLWQWVKLFHQHSNAQHVHYAIPHLRDISLLSRRLYEHLALPQKNELSFETKGILMLFQTKKLQEEEIKAAELAQANGIPAEILSDQEIQLMEPDTRVRTLGGIYYPGDAHIHPRKWMQWLTQQLKQAGVKFYPHHAIIDLQIQQHKIHHIITNQETLYFDHIVVAAGVKTALLLKKMDIHIPLQPGKGYSFDLQLNKRLIHIPALLMEGRVAVSPWGNLLRISGTMEIGANLHTINQAKIRGMLKTLHAFYPDLKAETLFQPQIWTGARPCSPDGLPFIGRVQPFHNLYVATGHGMLGLSLAPATGYLITQLISGDKPDIDIHAFDPMRFRKKSH